jgi:hypothetical protein
MIEPGDFRDLCAAQCAGSGRRRREFEGLRRNRARSSLTPTQITAVEEYLHKHSKENEP